MNEIKQKRERNREITRMELRRSELDSKMGMWACGNARMGGALLIRSGKAGVDANG